MNYNKLTIWQRNNLRSSYLVCHRSIKAIIKMVLLKTYWYGNICLCRANPKCCFKSTSIYMWPLPRFLPPSISRRGALFSSSASWSGSRTPFPVSAVWTFTVSTTTPTFPATVSALAPWFTPENYNRKWWVMSQQITNTVLLTEAYH